MKVSRILVAGFALLFSAIAYAVLVSAMKPADPDENQAWLAAGVYPVFFVASLALALTFLGLYRSNLQMEESAP